ncbi:MAG: chemotaxis-specific protein-glutamate methyltransferase CheB [Oscillospiraceae bacterium]|nr:chemotaxis-specific protein-glutamate methyltransferase CheB [Oscillospiraceae bacterium]
MKSKIRVLVVDDSPLFREVAAKLMSHDERIEIVATAGDPYEARDKLLEHKPDVMVLDIEMPKMNGITFLEKLIPQFPIPVVICSSTPINAFAAVEAGAVDYVRKPLITSTEELNSFAQELNLRVKVASTAQTIRSGNTIYKVMKQPEQQPNELGDRLIAIGGSTGATEAVPEILKDFTRNTAPVVVVVHMPENFTTIYAQRLRQQFPELIIEEARNGMYLKKGSVTIAAGNRHMRVYKDDKGYYITSLMGEKVSGHCPSVDVLFESVAASAGENAVAAILTGMGSDGAKGLRAIRDNGGYTIGQDKETSVVYGMPYVAFENGAVVKQLPLSKIGKEIISR